MIRKAAFVASLLGLALAADRARADDCAIDVGPDPLELISIGPVFASGVQRGTAMDVDDDNCIAYVAEGVSIVPLAFQRQEPIFGRSVDLLAFDDGTLNPLCDPNGACLVPGAVLYGAFPFDKPTSIAFRETEVVLLILP